MKEIINQKFPFERDLYGAKDLELISCQFDGVEDGESALKEAKNIKLVKCFLNLRYPLWHDDNVILDEVTMTDKCRAALWYTNNLTIKSSKLLGIKALRECNNINIDDTQIESPEFGWKSHNIIMNNSSIIAEYLFLLASEIELNKINFKGKYSFQYVKNMTIKDSFFDTKDAFWHSENVTVENSVIKGEYLAWYSKNLTLINCKIIGTQPFCYCERLKLIDCTMEATDFSFEYSDVDAVVKGKILSVKNPKTGKIVCDSIDELIYTEDSKYKCECVILEKNKK